MSANHLSHENSPYLLQHAGNPVDWYPWGDEAFEKAKSEDKPVFLSVGYAACHWCHVMAHESFEDPAIAQLMNEHFVNIKVDREERPDIDGIYMQAVVAMTGQGGWPMSVFITPQGEPFYCGTYFPPVRKYNMPAFGELLETIGRLWREDRGALLEIGKQVTQRLQDEFSFGQESTETPDALLNQASLNLARAYDWQNGGWGKAPKFPQPMAVEYLLRRYSRGDKLARDIALHALQQMAKGGMYDILGGGFSRYSTDDHWLVPHFEKMLYDNAQLALVYLHAWLVTGEAWYRRICQETLDFIVRELSHPDGGFFSSLDADSEGQEGKYYLWTADEIRAVLNNEAEYSLFAAAYRFTAAGNFEGKTVLQRAAETDALAGKFNLAPAQVEASLQKSRQKLLEVRSRRIRPATDDKVLVSWNALALTAFAEAGRYLNRPDYTAVAQKNAGFLVENLVQDGKLQRSWRSGIARHNAYLEDFAALIVGLLSLYQTDANLRWYQAAAGLTRQMVHHFQDPQGGFFDTPAYHETLITRPKDLQDNATPSGNALAAQALLLMSSFDHDAVWENVAGQMVNALLPSAIQYPTAFAQWLAAADYFLGPVAQVVIIGNSANQQTLALRQAALSSYAPRQILAQSDYPVAPGAPQLFLDRDLKNGLPTAYVCKEFVCYQPTNQPAEMAGLLKT